MLLTHLSWMNFPISIDRTSLFQILGVLSGITHFYSKVHRVLCRQSVETQIRRRILRHLIWGLHCLRMSHKMDDRFIWVNFWTCFCFQIKMLVTSVGIHKMLVRIANREERDQTASSKAVWTGSASFCHCKCSEFVRTCFWFQIKCLLSVVEFTKRLSE